MKAQSIIELLLSSEKEFFFTFKPIRTFFFLGMSICVIYSSPVILLPSQIKIIGYKFEFLYTL